MVKVSKAVAAANAAEVLKAAGQVMRAHGTGAATMAAIAAKADLTHGAVYRHFTNKDELAAAAITADFQRIVMLLNGIALQGGSVDDYINTYLGTNHRDHFDWGCPIAPLASEIHRDASIVQKAFAEGLEHNIDALLAVMQQGTSRADAMGVLAALSGAMAMARATRDTAPELSKEILAAARSLLLSPRGIK